MKNLFWRVGRLWCAGIVLLLLRLTQNRSGFDPVTGLSVPSMHGRVCLIFLAICAVGELILFFRSPKEKTDFSVLFAPPEKELPAVVLGSLLLILLAIFVSPWWLLPLGVYFLAIFTGALLSTGNLKIALMAVPAALIQLGGYGLGFIKAFTHKIILRRGRNLAEEVEIRKGR